MKRLMRPVDIVVWTDCDGSIHPVQFRYRDKIVKIDKVNEQSTDRFGGNIMLTFDCWGTCDEKQRRLMLKYETKTCVCFSIISNSNLSAFASQPTFPL